MEWSRSVPGAKWIPVDQCVPPPGIAVLIWIISGDDGDGMIEFAERTPEGRWMLVGGAEVREPYDVPTYWIPLPPPPETTDADLDP